MRLRFLSSFRAQILAFALVMVLMATISILLLVFLNTARSFQLQANSNIDQALQVFEQRLAAREQQLEISAAVLVADFGFKQALSSRDQATIVSALNNQGARIQADLMFTLNLQGDVTASSRDQVDDQISVSMTELLQSVSHGSSFSQFELLPSGLYLVVYLPVRAPSIIGFVGVGFQMNDTVLAKISASDEVGGSLLLQRDVATNISERVILASSLRPALALEQLQIQQTMSYWPWLMGFQDNQRYLNRDVLLWENAHQAAWMVISVDVQPLYERFAALRDRILLVSALLIFVTVLGSFAIAKGLTVPLQSLVYSARLIARGQYDQLPERSLFNRDISLLNRAFRAMARDLQIREHKIVYQNRHDVLTGLLNRDSFQTELKEIIHSQAAFLLFTFNMVRFRSVNDTLGPDIADACLQVFAKRLRLFPGLQFAARLGVDEFSGIVLVSETQLPATICQQLVQELTRPMVLGEVEVTPEIRMGYTHEVAFHEDLRTLTRRTNIALEYARQHHLACFGYQEGMDNAYLQRLEIIKSLKYALQANDQQLQMYYQPKMELASGHITQAEALIRWQHPVDGFMAPDMFIELAEQAGFIEEVTRWVVQRVLHDLQQLRDEGHALQIAINLSAQDVSNHELMQWLQVQLIQAGLSSADLCLELTERDVTADEGAICTSLQWLQEQGFTIALDDYGVGYSALSRLATLPVDEIKIDKSFVLDLATNDSHRIIVESTIFMAHKLNLSVVAEGVEDADAQAWLGTHQCDAIQGYHLARPMPLATFMTWLAESSLSQKERV